MAKKKGKVSGVGEASVVIRKTGDTTEIGINPSVRGASAGAVAGGVVGSVVPVVGTALGAGIGAVVGFLLGPGDA